MRTVSLMYHDVFDSDALVARGVSGINGNRYAVRLPEFEAHMATLSTHLPHGPAVATELTDPAAPKPSVMLTFDDGGLSAYMIVRKVLDRYGWKAHFFIVTDWIGAPHFMNATHIRELRARGHVIGSHSCSHPSMISSLSQDRILKEWSNSTKSLSDILGEEVTTASVPGGYYSDAVAEAASCSGIRALFTSEPTELSYMVGSCMIFGRYVMGSGTPPEQVAGLIQSASLFRVKEQATWQLKTLARNLGGKLYLKLRALALKRSCT